MVALWMALALMAGDGQAPTTSAKAATGYRLLLEKPYLPPDLDQEVFDQLWQVWEEPARSQAAAASPKQRRRMAFERYGFTETPGEERLLPLQYTPDGKGGWVMNCFACHGGKVAGKVIPGAPNTLLALQTFVEEVRQVKLKRQKPLAHLDVGSLVVPLGTTIGTTNAVVFGLALGANRDEHLNHRPRLTPPRLVHHDLDAPPLWNVRRKRFLYADGFASKHHRALMQFLQVERNGPNEFRSWEPDFEAILAWIETLEPPKYPWSIDESLAEAGRGLFQRHCAQCHGEHGPGARFPGRNIPIDRVQTDRRRLDAIPRSAREAYHRSWFTHYGRHETRLTVAGYVAPPLDGIWASAPYFHNGSVPTLWDVLHPKERPKVWRRSLDGYDSTHVGFEVERFDQLPTGLTTKERRHYFDTTKPGKSAAGHDFPDVMSPAEKRAVLEYLKTL